MKNIAKTLYGFLPAITDAGYKLEMVNPKERTGLAALFKPGPHLEADGMISIYDINTHLEVAQYEGLEIHEAMVNKAFLEAKHDHLVAALDSTQLNEYRLWCKARNL